jgi:hypothetical protein
MLRRLEDPQALLNPRALADLKGQFLQLGDQGDALFGGALESTRLALAGALHDIFFLGFVAMLVALAVTFFLKEIPFRRTIDDEGEEPEASVIQDPQVRVKPLSPSPLAPTLLPRRRRLWPFGERPT